MAEARKALWKCAVEFDPRKQVMQRRAETLIAKEIMIAMILGMQPPKFSTVDQYANFWMISAMRVRGSVLDFFRSEKLIRKMVVKGDLQKLTKKQIKDIQQRIFDGDPTGDIAIMFGLTDEQVESLRPSMLHYVRFVSLSRPMSDFYNWADQNRVSTPGESLADLIPSQCEDVDKQVADRSMVDYLKSEALLTDSERAIVDMVYSEDRHTISEVGSHFGMTVKSTNEILNSALAKMRAVAAAV